MAWNLAAEGVALTEEAERALVAELTAVLRKVEYGVTGSSLHGEVTSIDPLHVSEDVPPAPVAEPPRAPAAPAPAEEPAATA